MKRAVTLFFGLALAACAGTNREPETPDTVPAPAVALPASPPPMPPPDNLVQNLAPAKLAPLDNVDPQTLAAQEEAKIEAERNARDQAKWQRIGHEQDRKDTEETARDRLEKATDRVNAVQNRSSSIQGKRRLKLTHDIADFNAKRAEVRARVDGLPGAGSDEWKITKDVLDDALNELEALCWRVEGDM